MVAASGEYRHRLAPDGSALCCVVWLLMREWEHWGASAGRPAGSRCDWD